MRDEELPKNLIVGTMCHCDDPDMCDNHWEFFKDPVMGNTSPDHVRVGSGLNVKDMRAIAELVKKMNSGVYQLVPEGVIADVWVALVANLNHTRDSCNPVWREPCRCFVCTAINSLQPYHHPKP